MKKIQLILCAFALMCFVSFSACQNTGTEEEVEETEEVEEMEMDAEESMEEEVEEMIDTTEVADGDTVAVEEM